MDGGDTRPVTKAGGPAVGVANGPESGLGDASDADGAGAPDGGAAAARDCSETRRVTEVGANCLATAASGGAKLDAPVDATDDVKDTQGVAAKLKRGRGRVGQRS